MSDYLCEELIVEIFTRLPSKSLLRFRSLSKSLCSCISSPSFIRMHTFQSPKKVLFQHLYNDENKGAEGFYTLHEEDELSLYLCPKPGYIGITTTMSFPCNIHFRTVGSCNGTLCLRTKEGLCLWNPSIRRKLFVPECSHRSELRAPECPRHFEPRLDGIGFGFDPVSDDYKIVWVSYVKDSAFVYTVKTCTWCKIASPKPESTHVSYEGFLFNGVLHWEVFHELKGLKCFTGSILTFDLSTHVFGTISLPAPTWHWLTGCFTTIQGSLALISYRMNANWIRVWRDSSWSVVYKVEIGQLLATAALQVQPQTKNGDLLLELHAKGIQVYNLNLNTMVLSRVPDFNVASSIVNFHHYVETLHLLDIGETACETDQL